MIPENVPAVTYTGNDAVTRFDFDFLVEDADKLIVELTTEIGTIIQLQYGVDYSVNEFNNPEGSYIIYPITASEHTKLNANQKISLYLTLPAEQPSEYSKSSELDFELLEYSLDYLTRLIQILMVQLEQCARLPIGSKESMQELINQLANGNTLAQKWAEWMDGTVDGFGYSAKYHAAEAEEIFNTFIEQGNDIIQRATEEADRSAAYAEQAEFGMKWIAFPSDTITWHDAADGVHKELLLPDSPITVAVYSGTWDNKKIAVGVNIIATDTGTKILSKNTFNGFALTCASVLNQGVHVQDTLSDEWIINHNLGHIPHLTVVDENYDEPICGRHHNSLNQCVITFQKPHTGKVYFT